MSARHVRAHDRASPRKGERRGFAPEAAGSGDGAVVGAADMAAVPAVAPEFVQETLQKHLEPLVESAGLHLIAFQLGAGISGQRLLLQLDRPVGRGAVTLDDCSVVSRKISALVDAEIEAHGEAAPLWGVIAGAFDLEVSSPGMQRILRHQADFERFLGMTAKVVVQHPDGRAIGVIGVIAAVDAHGVTLKVGADTKVLPGQKARKDGKLTKKQAASAQTVVVPWGDVVRANLQPTLPQWQALGARLKAESAALGQVVDDDLSDIGDDVASDDETEVLETFE